MQPIADIFEIFFTLKHFMLNLFVQIPQDEKRKGCHNL